MKVLKTRMGILILVLFVAAGGLTGGILAVTRGGAQEPDDCFVLPGGKTECPGDLLEQDPGVKQSPPLAPGPFSTAPPVEGVFPTRPPKPYRLNPEAVLTDVPVHRVGLATQMGRTDCPATWNALVSDTTGMSVCFPAHATYMNGAKDNAWYGGPEGSDEGVVIIIPEGSVTIHRIGRADVTFAPEVSKDQLPTVQLKDRQAAFWALANADGSPVASDLLAQEVFGYIISQGDIDWEISAEVHINVPEIAMAKHSLNQIIDTVVIP